MTHKLHVDFECYAPVSLDDTGAPVFTSHPEFAITTFAWAFDDGPVQSLAWPLTLTLPTEITAHIAAGGIVCAHNAPFEHAVLTNHYKLQVKPEQLDCSMARAHAYGLPAGLGAAGRALNLSIVKDESGRANMLAMAKPPKKGGKPLHETNQAKLAELEAYCRQDVEAERALSKALPELSEFERKVSLLTARTNAKGALIDVASVRTLRGVADKVIADYVREGTALTGGEITSIGTQLKLKDWLAREGLVIPDLKKETVAAALAGAVTPKVRRALELRQLAAKSSLAKLDAMVASAGADDRARGQFQYYGASRTGRWAGRLVQPQNLRKPPKGTNAALALDVVLAGQEVPEMFYSNPLEVISTCIRPCIIAKPGHVLLSLDLAQIEARVTAWLAGQEDVLDAFRDPKQDVYVMTAKKVGSDDRQLGKVLTLACGFGMGGARFMQTAAAPPYNLPMSLEEAEGYVQAWRKANPMIAGKDNGFWARLTSASLGVLGVEDFRWKGLQPKPGVLGGIMTVGRVKLGRKGPTLAIKKPNGGYLFYHNPRATMGTYGPVFTFDGVDKKKWQQLTAWGGTLAENIAQAVARDILAAAIVRIEEELGLVPVMTVHDEAVYEIPASPLAAVRAEDIKRLFEVVPSWAPGLPIASNIRCSRRYGK